MSKYSKSESELRKQLEELGLNEVRRNLLKLDSLRDILQSFGMALGKAV